MKVPCCSVCRTRYNEEERVPLLLQCGHGFCKECLSRMFSASPDTSLPCPRCRHMSLVGNSVQALKKNYGILALLDPNPNSAGCNSRNDFVYTDEKKDDDGGRGEWQCKHKVVVKKVGSMEGMDVEWVQGQLESLRRASMWCGNVCTFHGVVRLEESSLGIVMDRCHGSIQSAMLNNEGRLTLEQVLRFFFFFINFFGPFCLMI